MSAPPKPTPDRAALFDRVLGFANAHHAREGWLAARDFLSLAVQINPDYPRLLGSLGSLQFQLQEYPAALATFSAVVRQTPDDPDLHIQLAMVQIKLQQVDEAKAALQRSLSLRPNNPPPGRCSATSTLPPNAMPTPPSITAPCWKAIRTGVNLLLHLGKCQYELGEMALARWCYERIIAAEPSNAIALEALQILAAKISLGIESAASPKLLPCEGMLTTN